MAGESLKKAILGDDTPNGCDEVYCIFDCHFAVVQQRMAKTRTHQLTFYSAVQGELYDLVVDPYQLTDLYGRPEYEDARVDPIGRMRSYTECLDDPLPGWFSRMSGTYQPCQWGLYADGVGTRSITPGPIFFSSF